MQGIFKMLYSSTFQPNAVRDQDQFTCKYSHTYIKYIYIYIYIKKFPIVFVKQIYTKNAGLFSQATCSVAVDFEKIGLLLPKIGLQ